MTISVFTDQAASLVSLGVGQSGSNEQDIVLGLVLASIATSGHTMTVQGANIAENTLITIPDPGSSTANITVSPAALVNGNLVSASGTAGLVQDSGVSSSSISTAVTNLGNLKQTTVVLNATQMAAAYATPATLVAAPGTGKALRVISADVYTASTGQTALATGTAPIIQYGTTVHGGGTAAVGAGLVAGDITASTSQIRTVGAVASSALTAISNVAITFSNATGAYTAGTGTTVTFTLVYEVLTATV